VSCSWCERPPLLHSLEEARTCLERIAWREVDPQGTGSGVLGGRPVVKRPAAPRETARETHERL